MKKVMATLTVALSIGLWFNIQPAYAGGMSGKNIYKFNQK